MKIIIFTETKVGAGHYQAAKAIERTLKSTYHDQVEVSIYSGLRCIHPLVEWFTVETYFFLLKFIPNLWKNLYTKIRKNPSLQTLIFSLRLQSLINKEKPDIILCTHPTCIAALCKLKQKRKASFMLGVVSTDFSFHPFIVSKDVDYYFVAHSHVKQRLIEEYGLQSEYIFDYGIPLHPEFEKMGKFGLRPFSYSDTKKYHILVLGGSTGYGPLEEIIHVFQEYGSTFRLTVVTGKNRKLYQKMVAKQFIGVKVLGYVHNMPELLTRVDAVISKPGGLTASETIACAVPFIMINPIPGHEEANRRYLEQEGLGLYVENVPELPQKIKNWLENEEEWNKWQSRIEAQQKKGSSYKIVQTIMNV